jgi:hypothetical protein
MDELARLLWPSHVHLPIAAALIWLALHASHESALAKRLERDYGFKAYYRGNRSKFSVS